MLPLEGLRVLAVEQYGAGPFGAMFLADQGAEVIKIENPNTGGDFARDIGPYFFTPDDSQFFHAYNRNKKSLTLDLSTDAGRAVFHDLVATADAVASNLRGATCRTSWASPTTPSRTSTRSWSAPISPPTAAPGRAPIGRASIISCRPRPATSR